MHNKHHKYPKSFTISNQVESELVVRSTAELEEQIKKELQTEYAFGTPSGILPVSQNKQETK